MNEKGLVHMIMDRGRGNPLSDLERVRKHFPETLGMLDSTIRGKLSNGSLSLPPRGTGLSTGQARGSSSDEDMMPMSPLEGPPLPRKLGIRWPGME